MPAVFVVSLGSYRHSGQKLHSVLQKYNFTHSVCKLMLLLVKRFNIDEVICLWSSCIVWCLHLKIEFRSCARRRHWCDTREVEWTHSYITTTTGCRLCLYTEYYTFHRVNQICEIFPERHNQPPSHDTRTSFRRARALSRLQPYNKPGTKELLTTRRASRKLSERSGSHGN